MLRWADMEELIAAQEMMLDAIFAHAEGTTLLRGAVGGDFSTRDSNP